MNRRTWLALAASGVLASCGRKKGTGYAGYAVIATAADNSVSAVDLTSFRLAATVALPAPPSAVLTGEGACYVLSPTVGTVSVIDNKLTRVRSRKLAGELSEIRFSPDGKRLIAIAPGDRAILQIDPATLDVVREDRLDGTPTSLDISATHLAVVLDRQDVDLIEWRTGARARAHLDAKIGEVHFRADGKLLLSSNLTERSITGLTVPDLKVVAELPLAMTPQNLCFTPDGGQLFVSGEGMDAVAIVFPYNALEVEQTVLAGRNPGVMACSDSNPKFLFVANDQGSSINVLNVDTRKVIGLVQVGLHPQFIAITPDNQYVLVLDEGSGDLAVIHIPAIRANRDRSGVGLFTMLPVGNRPVHCAVLPKPLA